MTEAEKDAYKCRRAACISETITIGWQFSVVFVFWAVVAEIFLPVAPSWIWKFGLIEAHTFPFL